MAQKGFKKLEIDPEFKTLIRPLRREEYRQLEVNLAMEGCREAIIVWNDTIVDLLIRRMYVVANHVLPETEAPKKNNGAVQLDLFTDYAAEAEKQKAEAAALERERKIQAATLAIKKKYGKNAILKAMNLEEGATAKDRNAQIGGHKA